MKIVEKEYTIEEVATLWALHVKTVRRLFENEAGVLQVRYPSLRPRKKFVLLRIPESAVVNVHARLTKVRGRPAK